MTVNKEYGLFTIDTEVQNVNHKYIDTSLCRQEVNKRCTVYITSVSTCCTWLTCLLFVWLDWLDWFDFTVVLTRLTGLTGVWIQVSADGGEWGHLRLQRRPVFQGEAQTGHAVPVPPVSPGRTGEETHLPTSRGQPHPLPYFPLLFFHLVCTYVPLKCYQISLCVYTFLRRDYQTMFFLNL